jgi:hypothetical protein
MKLLGASIVLSILVACCTAGQHCFGTGSVRLKPSNELDRACQLYRICSGNYTTNLCKRQLYNTISNTQFNYQDRDRLINITGTHKLLRNPNFVVLPRYSHVPFYPSGSHKPRYRAHADNEKCKKKRRKCKKKCKKTCRKYRSCIRKCNRKTRKHCRKRFQIVQFDDLNSYYNFNFTTLSSRRKYYHVIDPSKITAFYNNGSTIILRINVFLPLDNFVEPLIIDPFDHIYSSNFHFSPLDNFVESSILETFYHMFSHNFVEPSITDSCDQSSSSNFSTLENSIGSIITNLSSHISSSNFHFSTLDNSIGCLVTNLSSHISSSHFSTLDSSVGGLVTNLSSHISSSNSHFSTIDSSNLNVNQLLNGSNIKIDKHIFESASRFTEIEEKVHIIDKFINETINLLSKINTENSSLNETNVDVILKAISSLHINVLHNNERINNINEKTYEEQISSLEIKTLSLIIYTVALSFIMLILSLCICICSLCIILKKSGTSSINTNI